MTIVTHDGLIIVVSNDGQLNEMKVAQKLNMQTGIIHTKYIKEKEKLLIIIREGFLKIFEPFKDMNVCK